MPLYDYLAYFFAGPSMPFGFSIVLYSAVCIYVISNILMVACRLCLYSCPTICWLLICPPVSGVTIYNLRLPGGMFLIA